MKKRILIGAGALVLAAAPAAVGLWGNASFAESVPVPVPASVQVVGVAPDATPIADDHGGDRDRDQRSEPGDDRATDGGDAGSDDHGGSRGDDATAPSGSDDHGGDAPRDDRIEPGDDRGAADAGRTDDPRAGADDSSTGGSSSRDGGRHGGRDGGDHGGGDDRGGDD